MIDKSAKQVILDYLEFIRFKVVSGTMTCEEMDELSKVFQENLDLVGTADDFAKFYGKTKTNITTVIDRKMISKPRRITVYSFQEFRQVVPKSWCHKQGKDD